ncbi:MAG: hypothetical protein WBF13_05065 [Candidatus Zixiibacteriota bacterium]
MNRFLLRAGLCLWLVLLAQHTAAQETGEEPPQGFGVAPTSVSIDAYPGRKVDSKFTIVTQETKKPTRFSIQVKDVGQRETGSKSPVGVGTGARSAAPWITIASEVVVPPNGRQVVPFTINVPRNAEGAYFAYVVVRAVPERPEAQIVTAIIPTIAIEVAVNTRSRSPLHLDVSDLSIAPGSSGSPGELILRAANTGTWKASVEGDVLLYGAKGTFPVRVPVPYGRGGKLVEIYPGLEVTLRCPLAKMPPPGSYKAVTRLLLNARWHSRSEFNLEIPRSLADAGRSGRLLQKSEFDLDLWVEPDLVEVTVPPGATRTIPIKIQNRDEREAQMHLAVSDVHVEKSGFLTYSERSESETGWVSVSPESLVVGPRRTSTVRAQVTVPKDRPDRGTLVRAVRLTASAQSKDEKWHSGNEFGVLVVAVDPQAPPVELTLEKPKLIRTSPDKNPSTAVLVVKNSGGRVARVSGQMVLERASGQRIRTLEVGKTQDEIILPGMEREFRLPIGPLDEGHFSVRAELSVAGDKASTKRAEVTFESVGVTPVGLR